MKRLTDMPANFWKLALAFSAAIWGGSFVVIKGALDLVGPSWLMAMRFALATLVLAVIFRRKLAETLDGSHFVAGAVLGVVEGLAFVIQNMGLAHTTPGRNAFLTAGYCVLVPFVSWALSHKRPGGNTYVAAIMCMAGVGFLSLGDDLSLYLGLGDRLTLVSAVLYAIQIALVSHLASAHDIVTLTVLQMGFSALTALAVALGTEPMPTAATFTPAFWWALAYLVILSSCLALLIQNVGQSKVPPAQAALLLSMESLFAVLASIVFMHEQITGQMLVGFALIFGAVLVSELGGMLGRRRAAKAPVPATEGD